MPSVVVVSGGFDPIHSGHINLLNAARALGDKLVVGVNSDEWLQRKKGRAFMPFEERVNIIKNLKMVDDAYGFDDSDGSANDAIRWALRRWPDAYIIFANGGDRNEGNIPEMIGYEGQDQIDFAFGVGGDFKANSSSWILNEWKSPRTNRPWGYYRNLHQDGPSVKVKELAVNPKSRLSMQRHRMRSEYWMVTHGEATVFLSDSDPKNPRMKTLYEQDELHIPAGTWHQLTNGTEGVTRIVEIQYGENCMEEDIERVDVDKDYGASLYE
jgi:D-beta-D-heptose 7-phosphate kinase/D-beta-D-heptose 1-phosphate adenosyltransferase